MSKKYKYSTYEQIPVGIQGYVMDVSLMANIKDIPLVEINDFLNELDEFYEQQDREFMSNPQNIEQMFLDMNAD